MEECTSSNGGTYYKVHFANGERKTTQFIFLPDEDKKYDPSSRRNKTIEAFFSNTLGIKLDPASEDYVDNLTEAFSMLSMPVMKGLHVRFKVGFDGLHALYVKGDKPTFKLAKRDGTSMAGYEDAVFESRGAVEAEIVKLNASRAADKQFKFHKFPNIQEYMEPKSSNSELLKKVRKSTEGAESNEDEF